MKKFIFIIIIVLLIFIIFLPAYNALREKQKVISKYEREIQELKEKNIQLIEEKRKLDDDPVYLEGVARDKMRVLKKGEVIYQLEPESGE